MTQLTFDPFYDGVPNQQGYVDVDADTRNALPRSSVGLQGTMIPKANLGGTPSGLDLHRISNAELCIDPYVQGQSSTVRCGAITPEAVAEATEIAKKYTAEPVDIPSHRIRSAAIMHALTDVLTKEAAARNMVTQSGQPIAASQQDAQRLQQPAVVQAAPGGTPVKSMHPAQPKTAAQVLRAYQSQQGAGPEAAQEPMARAVVPAAVAVRPTPAAAPSMHVIFEVANLGSFDAYYHDVNLQDFFVVLIFDTRHVGSMKYFPKSNAEKPVDLVMAIAGYSEVRVVRTTGIQYTHGDYEYCVLLTVERIPVEP